MNLNKVLENELIFLNEFKFKCIMISTTSKHDADFKLLPRRQFNNFGIISLMINDIDFLKSTLLYFDDKVDNIFIDIEQKQKVNLYKIAKNIIKKSELRTVKPNDTTVESCDILIRKYFNDNLINKKIIIIGTGNIAFKIALRLAERQAEVYIKGRTQTKEIDTVHSLNSILPKFSGQVYSYNELKNLDKVNSIISFISGEFEEESSLNKFISKETIIIDGGINNFNSSYVNKLLKNQIEVIRLDTRIAIPYQFMNMNDYIKQFFENIYGSNVLDGTNIVAGGLIGQEGSVIVDNIKEPNQIIGVADGAGGVKSYEQLTEKNRYAIQKVREKISGFH